MSTVPLTPDPAARRAAMSTVLAGDRWALALRGAFAIERSARAR